MLIDDTMEGLLIEFQYGKYEEYLQMCLCPRLMCLKIKPFTRLDRLLD